MPDFWYQVDLPDRSPLVRLIGLDSDHDSIGEERWNEQARWLDRELSQPARGRWTIVFAHHPLFSDAAHGDDQKLQADWGPSFKKHGVDFYLAGHDHDLEHLQMPGWPTSFVVSGAGGKETYEIEKHRAAFAREAHGFVHIRLTADTARVSFIDKKGERVYAFVRDRRGRVKAAADPESDSP